MKILLWIGNESNQIALASKINEMFGVDGIILETRKYKPKRSFKKLFEKVIETVFLKKIGNAWINMKSHYKNNYSLPQNAEIIDVENINSEEAFAFSKKINPDLIIVSGTRLVKEKMLSITPSKGILNLHTGLSPYIKGGPNCTNWCLSTKQFNLIGNTIMWIDLGIDTGNILTTELTPLSGEEDLNEIHLKVMEHGHDLYLKSINFLNNGGKSSVKQDEITKGKTYYTREWGLSQKINLIKNFKYFKSSIQKQENTNPARTIKIS